MKKTALILVMILILSALAGCSGGVTFSATINEASYGNILVAPVEGSEELSSSDLFSINITDTTKIIDALGKKTDQSSLEVGQTVEITYNGMIAESYPAQITADKIKIVG